MRYNVNPSTDASGTTDPSIKSCFKIMTSQITPGDPFAMTINLKKEYFINCLKDKNKLLENHGAENLQEAENFQIQISKMQENLHDLESALFEQTSHNAGKKNIILYTFLPLFRPKNKNEKI